MIEITSNIIEKAGLFSGCAFLAMMFAYYRKWSSEKIPCSFWAGYVFGDWHAVGRALTTLIALCVGAGAFDYLAALTDQQTIAAGIGLGLMVPEKAEIKQQKENSGISQKLIEEDGTPATGDSRSGNQS